MNEPETPDGATVLQAAMACLAGGGMDPQRIDMAGALAMTAALGVAADVAATLLACCAAGLAQGQAERRQGA